MSKRFIQQLMKLFIPYTIIILFIFSLSSYAYLSAFRKIQNTELVMKQQQIEQSKLVLDRHFDEVFHVAQQIANTPIIRSFSVLDTYNLDNNYSPVIQLRDSVDDFQIINSMVHRYFIFYKNTELVVSKLGINNYKYFDNVHFLYGHEDKDVFWNSLFDRHYNMVIQKPENLRGDQYQTLPIISSIGSSKSEATVYMQLYTEKIRESMTGYGQDFDGNFLIIDDEGKVLVSLSTQFGIEENTIVDLQSLEDEWITTSVASDVIPYTYVLFQSPEQVFAEINAFQRNTIMFFIATLIGGLLVSIILARYNTKPMMRLMDNNDLLAKRVENQLPYLRRNFLDKWLKGNYVSIDEILSINEFLKTKYVGSFYAVAIIDYQEHIDIFEDKEAPSLTQTEARRLIINDLLTENILNPAYIHNLDHNQVAVLFIDDCLEVGELEMMIRTTLSSCDEALMKANMPNIRYGVGTVYKDMTGVPTSLTEAMDAAVYARTNTKKKLSWYRDIEINQDICFYPPEIESRLFNCIRAGDRDQLEDVLRDLFHKNIVEKRLNHQMQQIFINEMQGTLVKLQQRTFSDDTVVSEIVSNGLSRMKEMTDLQTIQYCKQSFMEICKVYATKQGNRHANLMTRIDSFIKDNFSDPDFGLPVISDEFNVSYTYLSEIIKDFKDMSFINYLQKLRMAKAKELLEETDMQVKEIFTQCGYNSSNSFGKAFKRIHGVTASEYREKHRNL